MADNRISPKTPAHPEKPVRPEPVEGPAYTNEQLALRGNRFAPLSLEEMTPEQRAMVNAVMTGKRAAMQGPYNVLLRSPEMGIKAQAFGEQVRFGSSLGLRLNELAILLVARDWSCQFMWHAHREIAIKAGLVEAVVDAIAKREEPAGLKDDEAIVYRFCKELMGTRQVSDATFAATKDAFGERGVVDLMGTLAYYQLVAMALNVDRYPAPDGLPLRA
ncbi:MAG: carboxymuconolactone decarboxylase family protein [Ramlibacter sp.]|nr:carboxymuconolactone decarboxylase family protein [Ramlibacter sp.]